MGKGELWHPADQKPLNRSSPNLIHVITSWVPISTQNLDTIRPGISAPHIREIYTLCSHVYYTFYCCKELDISDDFEKLSMKDLMTMDDRETQNTELNQPESVLHDDDDDDDDVDDGNSAQILPSLSSGELLRVHSSLQRLWHYIILIYVLTYLFTYLLTYVLYVLCLVCLFLLHDAL